MIGVSRETGESLSAMAHIEQSIVDILTTPVGSRVMRREYGSNLPDLLDKPFNAATKLLMAAESATALKTFEPRLDLHKVDIIQAANNALQIFLKFTLKSAPQLGAQIFQFPLTA